MSLKNRSPPSPPPDLKQRVIICLNKLADRDTLTLATAELESIARNLTPESFSPFLNCIHSTDDSAKSPVRRQCISLLTSLSHSYGNSLSPHVSKMISTVARRLRDSDSAVRSACVEATTAMSSQITKPPFSAFSKPLIELLLVEQDANSQIGAAMCLAAAIDSAPDPDCEQLRKLLPRLGKLVKIEGFKGKAAVIRVIGSIIGIVGAGSKGILDWLVPCMVEFLSNKDWTARKAAAEALRMVAAAEKELAPDYKTTCVKALENRRFDKVKVVRETMNQTLMLWKEEVLIPSQFESSSKDNGSIGCFPSVAKSSNWNVVNTPRPRPRKVFPTSRSPPRDSSPVTNAKEEFLLSSKDRKNSRLSLSYRLDRRKLLDCESEIAESEFPSLKGQGDDVKMVDHGVMESVQNEDEESSKPETKQVLFNERRGENVSKFGGLRSGTRVVPNHDGEIPDFTKSYASKEVCDNGKDVENLSMIHEQLAQIENQQSSLLNLLEKFIGSSQNGINSLETRVHGLEMAVNEISYDLAESSGRFANADPTRNTCCKLPGTDFLSPKFWRKSEATSRFSSSGRVHSLNSVHNTTDQNSDAEFQTFQHQGRREMVNVCNGQMEESGFDLDRISKSVNETAERFPFLNPTNSYGASSAICTTSMNLSRR